ncbi:unnamed protein product [Linum trigynum]|uniref:Uncharacterized protein n=1 Tax=Linum trigynum TaxID=586398 RepID=A0AAV2CVC6_9ROSI
MLRRTKESQFQSRYTRRETKKEMKEREMKCIKIMNSEKTQSDVLVSNKGEHVKNNKEEAKQPPPKTAGNPKDSDISSFDISPLNHPSPPPNINITTATTSQQPEEPRKRRIVMKNVYGPYKKAKISTPPEDTTSPQLKNQPFIEWSNLYSNSQERLLEINAYLTAYIDDLNTPVSQPIPGMSSSAANAPVEIKYGAIDAIPIAIMVTPIQTTPNEVFTDILEYIRCKDKRIVSE